MDLRQAQLMERNGDRPVISTKDALENPFFCHYYAGAVSGIIAKLGAPTSYAQRNDYAEMAFDMAVAMHREEQLKRECYSNQSTTKDKEEKVAKEKVRVGTVH